MQPKPQHHQEVIEHVNDAVYTTDLLGNFQSVNPAGEQLTGYRSHELTKLNVAHIVVPKYMELVRQKMRQKFSKDVATVYEIEIKRKDGKMIPVEISSRALRHDGKAIGILGIARDIRERKMLERQKEIFFSLITHEIKNPISSIKAFAELLQKHHRKTNEAKPLHYATMINDQVDRLAVLINDFLDISQMNTGKFMISREPVDLHEIVENAVESFRNSAAVHRITLKGTCKLPVNADRGRIVQVLMNLLSNAVKYSTPDTPIIVNVSKKGKTAQVQVTNDGEGIPVENQKTIFELFYRLAHHQQDQIQGHGLGLYICKQIIKEHKGDISVESIENDTTTFTFTLPLLTSA